MNDVTTHFSAYICMLDEVVVVTVRLLLIDLTINKTNIFSPLPSLKCVKITINPSRNRAIFILSV